MKRSVSLAVMLLVLAVGAGVFIRSRRRPPGEEAFIGEKTVTVWSRLSQVREPVATLRYGERVEVLDQKKDEVELRTATGATGWTEQRYLMGAALWHHAAELSTRARGLAVQARAHTRVPTNVHIEPGRAAARVFQFSASAPLEVLERAVAEVKPSGEEAGATKATGETGSAEAQEIKKEDWVLVRGKTEEAGEVAGWVLRRFIEYDTPIEIADYAQGFRFVAWFELNRVPAGDKTHSQFLAAGVQGGDGQPCDFTLLRVYTWGAERHRYETAYVESFLCGHFPIRVTPAVVPAGDASFSFVNEGKNGKESREYAMHQTSVHRVDNERRRAGGGRTHR